jgi:hypothetical protein
MQFTPYNVDIVMCIDATASMKGALDMTKAHALSFAEKLEEKMQAENRAYGDLRVKVIVFRDFGIDADGNPLCMVYHEDGTEPDIYDVVPLPERHGRLADLDELMNRARGCLDELTILSFEFLVNGSSTIVPAEGGGEE